MSWRDLTANVMRTCRDTFGENVVYISKGLAPQSIQAIFDNEFQQVDPTTGILVVSQQPIIGILDTDLQQASGPGDRVLIRGIEYRIVETQPDGQAGTKLLLNKIK